MADIKILTDSPLAFNAQAVANSVIKTLNQTGSVSVELSMVDGEFIKSVNNKFRDKDAVTDVLSFPTIDNVRYSDVTSKNYPLDFDNETQSVFIGSILICEERAKEQALEFNHSLERELCYLFCHGLLHLFGYDHILEADDFEMRELATKILNDINVTR